MNRISLGGLGKIAIGVTLVGTGSMYATRWAIQSKLRESESYKEAMRYLRDNKDVLELLGEPVHEKRIDIGDSEMYGERGNLCWATVPLVGEKHKGDLRYWVKVTDRANSKFHVSRVELDLHGSGTKIVLMDAADKARLGGGNAVAAA